MLRAFESLGDMRGRCTTREPRKSRLYASCGVPFGVVCPIKDLPQALEGLLSTHKRVGGLATVTDVTEQCLLPSDRQGYPNVNEDVAHPCNMVARQ